MALEVGFVPGIVVVPVDLRTDWVAALVDHGFRSGEPVAWLAEGILYALRPDEADQFLGALTAASGPGSRLYFDHLTDSTTLHHARAAVDPALNEMWHGGPTEPPGAWLRRYGWTARVHDLVDLAAGFGRPVPAAFDPARPQSARAWLVEARRP